MSECPNIELRLPDGSVLHANAVDDENFPAIEINLTSQNGETDKVCFVEYNPERENGPEVCIGVYNSKDDETVYYDAYVQSKNGNKKIHPYEECDFYSIEMDAETSEKSIHIWGYIYHGGHYEDKPYRDLEYTNFIVPLKYFLELKSEGDLEQAVKKKCEANTYIADITESEAKQRLKRYWHYHIIPNQDEFPKPLPYEEITMDTPCDSYVNYKNNTAP